MKDSVAGKAFAFCVAAHEAVGQKRKYTGEPYWTHPQAVAELVIAHADLYTLNMVSAALLHDVVEDTDVSLDAIRLVFNDDVARLVDELTKRDYPEGTRRADRMTAECERLRGVSNDAKTIKLADLIHNTESIVEHDAKFAAVYMQEKRSLLGALVGGDERLHAMATQIVQDYFGEAW